MLALLRTYSWRELRHHPWRSAAAVIAVMLGVALALSVQLINASALAEFAGAVSAVNGQPDLSLRARQGGLDDALVERLAKPLIDREKYPSMHANDGWEAQIRALVAAELADKVQAAETIENPATARLPDESGG